MEANTPTCKELLTIEFRYVDMPNGEFETQNKSKTITIGVFDTFDEAAKKGNDILKIFEKQFKLNPNWNKKERFSKNGGCFGSQKRLITNLAYLQTPFDFYANIIKLNYEDVEQTVLNVLEATKRYKNWKDSEL